MSRDISPSKNRVTTWSLFYDETRPKWTWRTSILITYHATWKTISFFNGVCRSWNVSDLVWRVSVLFLITSSIGTIKIYCVCVCVTLADVWMCWQLTWDRCSWRLIGVCVCSVCASVSSILCVSRTKGVCDAEHTCLSRSPHRSVCPSLSLCLSSTLAARSITIGGFRWAPIG